MFNEQDKSASNDRVLVLETIDGKKPLSSTGLVDPRLFTGGNKLHAVLDSESLLWHFKYDQGILPEALKQRYTTFPRLKQYAEDYFKTRNIKIVDVVNAE